MASDENEPHKDHNAEEAAEEAGHLLESYAEAMEEGRLEDADETMAAFLESLAEWTETQPEKEEDWTDRGDDAFEAGDLEQAERCYLQAVSDAEGVYASHTPRSSLIGLYGLQNRNAEAVEIARAQVDDARKSDMEVFLAGCLESLGHCLVDAGDLSEAEAVYTETLSVYGPGVGMSATLRARVLVARANVRSKRGDPAGADADLATAWDLVSPQAGMVFSGAEMVLAAWWGVTARRRESIGDITGAVEAWREAVECRRRFGTGPLDPGAMGRANRMRAFADTLRHYADALRLSGNDRAAADAFFEIQQIRASIGLPPDED